MLRQLQGRWHVRTCSHATSTSGSFSRLLFYLLFIFLLTYLLLIYYYFHYLQDSKVKIFIFLWFINGKTPRYKFWKTKHRWKHFEKISKVSGTLGGGILADDLWYYPWLYIKMITETIKNNYNNYNNKRKRNL